MSSAKIPLNNIIIGTSSWGSKSSYKNSFNISKILVEKGLVQFDSAPNYGSGYSHNILNLIGKKENITVNTKFGQKTNISFYEILKRIYRFNNLKSYFLSNYNLYNSSKINKKKFWSLKNITNNLYRIQKELNNCNIDVFFLHSPKNIFIYKNYLNEFEKFCFLNNLKPGISNVDDNILENVLNYHSKYVIQMPLTQYLNFEKLIFKKNNTIHINSIFRSRLNQEKFDRDNYLKDIIKYFKKFKNIKLVFGINSIESCKNLIKNI